MKVPVIPFNLFNKLMHDQGVKDKKVHLKEVIDELPDLNYLSLLYLLGFLKYDVVPHEKQNKMTTKNIGICFSPCLLRAEKTS